MRFSTGWLIILTILFSTACAKKSATETKVTFQMDSIFQGSVDGLSKMSTVSSSGLAPNWGVSDPTLLSQIKCWAVFVSGPEDHMRNSQCTNGRGNSFSFGARSGFFKFDEKGEIMVPSGRDRVFWLVGMASLGTECPTNFDKETDINFDNFSAPFILNAKEVRRDLDQEEVKITIEVDANFSSPGASKVVTFLKKTLSNSILHPTLPTEGFGSGTTMFLVQWLSPIQGIF